MISLLFLLRRKENEMTKDEFQRVKVRENVFEVMGLIKSGQEAKP